ncbi:hypothetical protein VTK26DRAFT_9145 [Humicola hyalothermophila]
MTSYFKHFNTSPCGAILKLLQVSCLTAVVVGRPSLPGQQQFRFSSSPNPARTHFGPLQFRADGTFRLSIFQDLHFGESAWESWGSQQDLNAVRVVEAVLDAEPGTDLIVINGDLITGENTFLENSTHYVDQIVRPMLRRGLTWASVYGNHDNDYNISSWDILAREKRWPNSRTSQMVLEPDSGVCNYYLPVYPADCRPGLRDCFPKLLLWFFDSRGGFYFQQKDPASGQRIGRPNWVDARVANWFQRTNSRLVRAAGGKVIPSLGFVHIPTNASRLLQEAGVEPPPATGHQR